MIPSTHLSLLEALTDPRRRNAAWTQFQGRYEQTIYRWCVRCRLQPAAAEAVTQAVLVRLYEKLPEHQHQPDKRFRSWLKAVVNNAVRDVFRNAQNHTADFAEGGSGVQELLANVEAPAAFEQLAEAVERLADPHLEQAIEHVRPRVAEITWQAFWRTTVDGLSAPEVAAELQMTQGAVSQAKRRVTQMLREKYRELHTRM